MADHIEGTFQVHLISGIKVLLIHAHDQFVAGNPSVVDQNINRTEQFFGLADDFFGSLKIADIS